MSKFLPYDSFDIETSYTPEEVQECVQALIEGRAAFDTRQSVRGILRLPQAALSSVPFAGTTNDSHFRVFPRLGKRNTPHPQFYGTITPTAYGSIVHIKIRLAPIMLLFWGLWAVALVLFLPPIVMGDMWGIGIFGISSLLLYLITMLTFYEQVTPAKQALLQAFAPQNEMAVE